MAPLITRRIPTSPNTGIRSMARSSQNEIRSRSLPNNSAVESHSGAPVGAHASRKPLLS